jgi:hypothetical protein
MIKDEDRCKCDEPQPIDVVYIKGYRLVACYRCQKVIYETPDDEQK